MWSGPRNISTAMMRSFENRSDCEVVDEPFYAAYLATTELEHPGFEEIVASQPTRWQTVAERLTTERPAAVYFQKHMTQHLLEGMDLSFTRELRNCFLIRDPARIILSYARVRPSFSLEELGIPQQVALFDTECERLGEAPPVLDAALTLADPERVLRRLCQLLGIEFEAGMLRWPAGPRTTDGVWSPYWYSRVLESTGFESTLSAAPSRDAPSTDVPSSDVLSRDIHSRDESKEDKAPQRGARPVVANAKSKQVTKQVTRRRDGDSAVEAQVKTTAPLDQLKDEQLEMYALAQRSYEQLRRYAIDGASV
ncbi:MAG: HAD family hydrolase [Pseudomonadota bacterium]